MLLLLTNALFFISGFFFSEYMQARLFLKRYKSWKSDWEERANKINESAKKAFQNKTYKDIHESIGQLRALNTEGECMLRAYQYKTQK